MLLTECKCVSMIYNNINNVFIFKLFIRYVSIKRVNAIRMRCVSDELIPEGEPKFPAKIIPYIKCM